MGNITYVVSVRNAGVRATGLSLSWVQLKKLSDNSNATQPSFTEIGQGQYKFTYDAETTGEAAGQIDAGSSVTADADRYIDVVLARDSSRLVYSLPLETPGNDGGLPIVDGSGQVAARVTEYASDFSPAEQILITPANKLYTDTAGRVLCRKGGNRYFVSSAGNDSNSGLLPSAPKLTIASAVSSAVAGDTVHVMAGTYNSVSNIGKNGVSYFFDLGAIVNVQQTNGHSIWGDGDGAKSIVVRGQGVFNGWLSASNLAYPVNMTNASSRFDIECLLIDGNASIGIRQTAGQLIVNASEIACSTGNNTPYNHIGGEGFIRAKRISSVNYDALILSGGKTTVYADHIIAGSNAIALEGGGTHSVVARLLEGSETINCEGAESTTMLSIECDIVDSGGGDAILWGEALGYIKANRIYGGVTVASGSLNLTGAELNPAPAVSSGAVLTLLDCRVTGNLTINAGTIYANSGTEFFGTTTGTVDRIGASSSATEILSALLDTDEGWDDYTVRDAMKAALASSTLKAGIVGTQYIIYAPDGTTPFATFNLNSTKRPTFRTKV